VGVLCRVYNIVVVNVVPLAAPISPRFLRDGYDPVYIMELPAISNQALCMVDIPYAVRC